MKLNLSLLLSASLSMATLLGCTYEDSVYNSELSFSEYYSNEDYSDEQLGENYTDYGENDFVSAIEIPFSTFSVDADGASYANMRRYITSEMSVPPASVRVEEFLNYFTFNYPEPNDGDILALSSEITKAPWSEGHYLLRLGIKAKSIALEKLPPSNYVFLVDVSGSMSSSNKMDLLKQGLSMLADNIRDDDRVTIVTYSGNVKMALEPTLGRDREDIKAVISELYANGSTNGGEAIQMAYQAAKEYYVKGGNNRVILATDGDFNVGVTSTDAMIELIEEYLDSGIYLTVLGFGSGNLNESMMEQVANCGNGNYEYIDCVAQMKKVFVDEITKLYCIAKDSKIQVQFNPSMVDSYRLIGYENRTMSEEEFDDEKSDAGEIGVGQTITALYEIIPTEGATSEGTIAEMTMRYKDGSTQQSYEVSHLVSGSYTSINNIEASEDHNFAASLALFAMLLKESNYSGSGTSAMAIELAEGSSSFDPNGLRAEFVSLMRAN